LYFYIEVKIGSLSKYNNHIRIVTAASLFDGHDAAINIMRRILQSSGAEVIHLGHNRSAAEIVDAAIQEDVQAIAITSYQGGHIEFFKYIYDLLQEQDCGHIKIFGGGGGTILPDEIKELQAYGITRIYTPDDGREMGLQGMIDDLLLQSDFNTIKNFTSNKLLINKQIAQTITFAENNPNDYAVVNKKIPNSVPVLGITGTGGAGKSSVTDELVRRFLREYKDKRIAIISVDPSKKKTGGALLGDRIRMNAIHHHHCYMRSMATRESEKSLSNYVQHAINICKCAGFDIIILESSGIGQSDTSIIDYCDISMYVMTPEYGAASQLEKIGMLDYANIICMNKMDKGGALDSLHDVKKQYRRNHRLFEIDDDDDEIPVIGTMASKFNDEGMNVLFAKVMNMIAEKTHTKWIKKINTTLRHSSIQTLIIPPARSRYLAEITETIQSYNDHVDSQSSIATRLYQIQGVIDALSEK